MLVQSSLEGVYRWCCYHIVREAVPEVHHSVCKVVAPHVDTVPWFQKFQGVSNELISRQVNLTGKQTEKLQEMLLFGNFAILGTFKLTGKRTLLKVAVCLHCQLRKRYDIAGKGGSVKH